MKLPLMSAAFVATALFAATPVLAQVGAQTPAPSPTPSAPSPSTPTTPDAAPPAPSADSGSMAPKSHKHHSGSHHSHHKHASKKAASTDAGSGSDAGAAPSGDASTPKK